MARPCTSPPLPKPRPRPGSRSGSPLGSSSLSWLDQEDPANSLSEEDFGSLDPFSAGTDGDDSLLAALAAPASGDARGRGGDRPSSGGEECDEPSQGHSQRQPEAQAPPILMYRSSKRRNRRRQSGLPATAPSEKGGRDGPVRPRTSCKVGPTTRNNLEAYCRYSHMGPVEWKQSGAGLVFRPVKQRHERLVVNYYPSTSTALFQGPLDVAGAATDGFRTYCGLGGGPPPPPPPPPNPSRPRSMNRGRPRWWSVTGSSRATRAA